MTSYKLSEYVTQPSVNCIRVYGAIVARLVSPHPNLKNQTNKNG